MPNLLSLQTKRHGSDRKTCQFYLMDMYLAPLYPTRILVTMAARVSDMLGG